MKDNFIKKPRFWPLLGIVIAVDIIIAILYTLIVPGLSGRALSDSLCTSALFLGFVSALPVLLDAGRGVGMATRIGATSEERQIVWAKERQRREQGMLISFVLGTATLLVTLLSFILGLL